MRKNAVARFRGAGVLMLAMTSYLCVHCGSDDPSAKPRSQGGTTGFGGGPSGGAPGAGGVSAGGRTASGGTTGAGGSAGASAGGAGVGAELVEAGPDGDASIGGSGGADASSDGSTETSGQDAGLEAGPDCPKIGVSGPWQLVISTPSWSKISTMVSGLDPTLADSIEIGFWDGNGPQISGTFDLSLPPDNDYETCSRCVLVREDSAGTETLYFVASGTMNITAADATFKGKSAGALTAVKLVEVLIDGLTFKMTVVPNGKCVALPNLSWDTT